MALWPGATAQTDGAVRQSIPWLPPMWKYEEGGRLGALMVVDATGADELIITTITHDHADRVRSYQLLAEEWNRR